MKTHNCMLFALLVLLTIGAADAQTEVAGTLLPGLESQESSVFGDIALEMDGNRRVVLAIDRNGDDGLTDLMIAFEAREPVEAFDTFRGYGLVRLGSASVVLNLPDLQETLVMSTQAEAPVAADLHRVAVRRFLNGRSLATWTPQPTSQLPLEEALRAEIRRGEPELRSLSDGIFQQDPGTGGDSGCAASCSVTCHDGTSCSVSCTSGKCAQCSCPNAACWCTDAP